MEDLLESDEKRYKAALKKHLGRHLPVTGDPLIDMWEEQLARGEDVDLSLGEDERAKRHDEKVKKKVQEHYERTGERIIYRESTEQGWFTQRTRLMQDKDFNPRSSIQDQLENVPTEAFDAFLQGLSMADLSDLE